MINRDQRKIPLAGCEHQCACCCHARQVCGLHCTAALHQALSFQRQVDWFSRAFAFGFGSRFRFSRSHCCKGWMRASPQAPLLFSTAPSPSRVPSHQCDPFDVFRQIVETPHLDRFSADTPHCAPLSIERVSHLWRTIHFISPASHLHGWIRTLASDIAPPVAV